MRAKTSMISIVIMDIFLYRVIILLNPKMDDLIGLFGLLFDMEVFVFGNSEGKNLNDIDCNNGYIFVLCDNPFKP